MNLALLLSLLENPRQEAGGHFAPCPLCHGEELNAYVLHTGKATFDLRCGCLFSDVERHLYRLANGRKPAVNGVEPGLPSCSVVSGVRASELDEPPHELEHEAFYGLAGQVVLAIEPHTESHPAGLMGSFLVGAGCLFGPGPHVVRDARRHAGNEFWCLVGPTGAGGKGSSTAQIEKFFSSSIDSNYTIKDDMSCEGLWQSLILGGLGSGEALVEALADPDEPEKRRLVFEEEFSKPLTIMRREGSTLSQNLRAAWDGGVLRNRTKGKRLEARGCHVSVLAHVTRQELAQFMTSTEVFNGFANRFLWFWTRRVRELPFGGGHPPIAPLVSLFHEVLEYSRGLGEMEFDADVKRLWTETGIYKQLRNRTEDFFGAITSRAATHVTRLALIYAVLDAQKAIMLPHMLAALAVWDYSERTCRYLFAASCGDDYADTILEILGEVHPGGLTRTEIRDRFGRNAPAGRIPKALALLEKEGKAERVAVPTAGRAAEYWRVTLRAATPETTEHDGSPLERAREWVEARR